MKTFQPLLLASLLLVPGVHAQQERPAPMAKVAPAPAVTEATLSLLEPASDGCEWAQVDPVTPARRVIVKLAVECQGASTALSRDGK